MLLWLGPLDALAEGESRNFSAQRFTPSKTKEGVNDVEAPAIVGSGALDAAIWLHYARNPLVLYERTADGKVRAGALVRDRLDADLVLAVALLDRLELGVDLGLVLYQGRADSLVIGGQAAALGSIASIAMGDLRLQPKVQFLKDADFGIDLSLAAQISFPAAASKDYLGDTGFTVAPLIAVGRTLDQGSRFFFNLGYLARAGSTSLGLHVDDQLLLKGAVAHRFDAKKGPPIELGADLSLAVDAGAPFSKATETPLEALFSAAYDFAPWATGFVGGGLGLGDGYAAPDFRLWLGLRYSLRERDKDHDGIEDAADACIDVPEDIDQFEDQDGCPDADNDQDGILDGKDGCPLEKEDVDQFEDDDGCPDTDNDKDGVLDGEDTCPLKAGPAENHGCPDGDKDGDRLVDRLDKCPEQPEDIDGFEDEDGCPDLDDDQDGIADVKDECPREKGPPENGGCPDKDRDGDTVVDRIDNCPDEPGPPSNKGCEEKQLVEITATKISIYDKVYFATGKATILPRSFKLLDNVARVVKAHTEIPKVIVEGHTDDRGSDSSNLKLSQARADSVRKFLIEAGVPKDRLEALGYGETMPIEPNKDEAGRSVNRRVEFTIPDKRSVE